MTYKVKSMSLDKQREELSRLALEQSIKLVRQENLSLRKIRQLEVLLKIIFDQTAISNFILRDQIKNQSAWVVQMHIPSASESIKNSTDSHAE